jgi:hypothetical protein
MLRFFLFFPFVLCPGIAFGRLHNAAPIRIACLGASITCGVTLDDPLHNSYSGQLQTMPGESYRVTNYGVRGSTMLKKVIFPCCMSAAMLMKMCQ